MQIEITKAMVLINTPGTDKVFLDTTLPSTMPNVSSEPVVLTFDVVAGGGAEYVKRVLGMEPEVIDSATGRVKGKHSA